MSGLMQYLRFAVGAAVAAVLVGGAATDIARTVARQVCAAPEDHVVQILRQVCAG